ncbi:MAG: hypothetical protein IT370_22555 [Deltaproteobacteria bacterium]|nr:hypothetical protein [Deltaproteobacteria bacterium]
MRGAVVIPAHELVALEARVEACLARGSDDGLCVLGHGEMSLVLGWPDGGAALAPEVAAKRLPVFASVAAFERYAGTLRRYLAALEAAGVTPLPTQLQRVDRADGSCVGYCVQPALAADALLPRVLARATPAEGLRLLREVAELACATVTAAVGLDAQLSNWALRDGQLCYLDVTTPLLAHPDGSTELDPALFLAAYPAPLRAPIRRFVLPGIVRRYHQRRSVLRDICANLVKERLQGWQPALLSVANAALAAVEPAAAPITAAEATRDYARDARMWAVMLWLRRADRFWQRAIRRKSYPFLLPRAIAR